MYYHAMVIVTLNGKYKETMLTPYTAVPDRIKVLIMVQSHYAKSTVERGQM